MTYLLGKMYGLARDRSGAGAIEYALIAAILSLGIVVAVGTFSDTLSNAYDDIVASFRDATT